jgi:hypothetical protein
VGFPARCFLYTEVSSRIGFLAGLKAAANPFNHKSGISKKQKAMS